MKHKIYAFNNGGSPRFLHAVAIADDGHVLADHCCSAEGFMRHDLGVDGTWKHENYNKHFGVGGWEIVWVPDPAASPELAAALKLNASLPETEPEHEPAGITVTYSDGTKDKIQP